MAHKDKQIEKDEPPSKKKRGSQQNFTTSSLKSIAEKQNMTLREKMNDMCEDDWSGNNTQKKKDKAMSNPRDGGKKSKIETDFTTDPFFNSLPTEPDRYSESPQDIKCDDHKG